MQVAEPVSLSVADGIALVRIANPPVNALSATVRIGLADALRRAASDPDVTAIVLASDGRTFSGGADITEFGKPPVPPILPDLIATFDALDKPLVAAIGGVALGGGLEIALGCHARVASPAAKLGLPEVKLGLLPGAGGTQRLPRLIGAAAALQLMAEGNPVSAEEAHRLGLVDEVADDVVASATALARRLVGGELRRTRDITGKLGARDDFEVAASALAKRHPDNPGVAACIAAVRASFELPFDQGLRLERAQFAKLVQDDRSRALRHVFFAERQAAHVVGLPAGTAARPIARAAVIGGGTMGGGIAMCFANAGIPVTMIETSDEALQAGLARVGQTYGFSVKRGSLTDAARDARMALIAGRVGLEAAADADIVIEAVFEDIGVKREVFAALGRIARPGAVLATNTSYLDVNVIAEASGRPADVLGMHFFSPANVMRLLEVVRGRATAAEALATAVETGRKLAKVPVVVGVCHGFVGNRMLSARSVQMERLLAEGALPEQIDAAITGFGFRMGPCAMADLAGLDIGWRIRQAFGMSAPVADALVAAGRLGQKNGKGFYRYGQGDRTPQPDAEVARLIERVSAEGGIVRRGIGADEIVERLTYPMINEGARILSEGIAARPGDIDVVWLNGYGWPAWRGGPMFYADLVGLRKITERLEAFAAASGEDSLRPAPLLRGLADKGGGFAGWRE
jgi:3-hydroxyacyl-CoA dehydrogenase